MSNSKNDIAWKCVFDGYKILDKIAKNGHFETLTTKQTSLEKIM